jgi:tryptophan halogenase
LRFTTGRRRLAWNRNVIAIGLSSGFLEPLESTSLHLIQSGIARLIAFFPDRHFDPLVSGEHNRIANSEMERILDFIILHFRGFGRLVQREFDLFGPSSWLAVHIGQGNLPQRGDPLLDYRDFDGACWLAKLQAAMAAAAQQLPTHREYIDRFCKSAQ